MKSIAIIGATGQVGTDLVKLFNEKSWIVHEVNHSDIAIENISQSQDYFNDKIFDVIVNTAAMHQVNKCETEIEKCWDINFYGASNVGSIANRMNAKYVYFSTDYVFSGNKGSAYTESDSVSPINAYGSSKAAGEISTLNLNSNNLVVRISSVFGSAGSSGKGGNFVEAIIKKAVSGEELKVVGDVTMTPSYTVDIANKLIDLIDNNQSGIFHLSNKGSTTWFEFAREICNQIDLEVDIKETSTDFSLSPKRPINSSLNTDKIETLGIEQREWKSALNSYLIEKGHLK